MTLQSCHTRCSKIFSIQRKYLFVSIIYMENLGHCACQILILKTAVWCREWRKVSILRAKRLWELIFSGIHTELWRYRKMRPMLLITQESLWSFLKWCWSVLHSNFVSQKQEFLLNRKCPGLLISWKGL